MQNVQEQIEITERSRSMVVSQKGGKTDAEGRSIFALLTETTTIVRLTKTIIFTLVLSFSAISQTAWVPVAMQVTPDGIGGLETTWEITWNGDTIAKGGPYPTTTFQSYTDHFYLPPDCCVLTFHDSACNGFGPWSVNGAGALLYRTDQMMTITQLWNNYGCWNQYTFCLGSGYSTPCENNCQSDINGDGIVNISDLTIMLSDYGQICPQ